MVHSKGLERAMAASVTVALLTLVTMVETAISGLLSLCRALQEASRLQSRHFEGQHLSP